MNKLYDKLYTISLREIQRKSISLDTAYNIMEWILLFSDSTRIVEDGDIMNDKRHIG